MTDRVVENNRPSNVGDVVRKVFSSCDANLTFLQPVLPVIAS
jgi:hypothetical protein